MSDIRRVFSVDGQSAAQSEKAFQAVRELHGSTLLIPVYWQQVEPEEGRFDFSGMDGLLANARRYGLTWVLLCE